MAARPDRVSFKVRPGMPTVVLRGAVPGLTQPSGGESRGCRHDEATARGRSAFRPPDPPLEPEDEALHLRRAQRHLHHRSQPDPGAGGRRLLLREGSRRRRWRDPVRRHEEADPGPRGGVRRGVRHALREPALARRHAHQLPDCRGPGPQARRSSRLHAPAGDFAAMPKKEALSPRARAGEARPQPRRHAAAGPAAGRDLRDRHQEGAHRRHRGEQARTSRSSPSSTPTATRTSSTT